MKISNKLYNRKIDHVRFNYDFQKVSMISIDIYNAQGALIKYMAIKSGTGYEGQLDLNGFIQGCYFVKLSTQQEVVTKRLIIK